MTVQLAELLDSPLVGLEGDAWKKSFNEQRPPKPEDFEAWADAQIFSLEAVQEYPKFKEMIYPLTEGKNKKVIQDLWKFVNLVCFPAHCPYIVLFIQPSVLQNYQAVSGKTIDALWGLDDVRNRKPSWHASPTASKKTDKGYDSDEPPTLVAFDGAKKGSKGASKKLAITDGNESDNSMPSLQTVSDSSDDEDYDNSSSEEEESDEDSDEDSEYDEEEEDRLRDMWREAMDIVAADETYADPRSDAPDFQQAAADKKENPFIKLLGGLRGIAKFRFLLAETNTSHRTIP